MEDYQEAEETSFVVDEVSNIVKEAIESAISGKAYQHSKVNQWTTNVIEQTLSQLIKLGKPFKYIVSLCNYAEEWGWITHCKFLLLGQPYRWELHCAVGKQDRVLYRQRLRAVHLTSSPAHDASRLSISIPPS